MVKVSSVVANFLDSADLGQAEYSRAYRIALRGVRKFSYDVGGTIQSTTLLINGDFTATKPEDCVKILRVGRVRNSGSRGSNNTGTWLDVGQYREVGNQIMLESNLPFSEVEIEYIALPKDGDEHYVHPFLEEALIAFIRWQWFLHKKNERYGDIQTFKMQYDNELRNAKYRMRYTLQELEQHARQTTRLKTRRLK